MGDLDVSSYEPLLTALPLVLVSFGVFAWLARPLNLLSLGAESAGTHGLDVTRAQRAAFFSASLATGAAVSVGGPDRVHRHHRAAPRPPPRRLRPPRRPAGVGALRRRVPDRVRRRRAHGDVAARAPGRRHHGAHRRAVLSVAAREEAMRVPAGPLLAWSVRRIVARSRLAGRGLSGLRLWARRRCSASPALTLRTRSARPPHASSLSSRPSPRCCSRSARDRRSSAVGSFDRFPPEVEKLPRVGALIDPDVERILSLRPDLVVVYGSQTDLRTQLERAQIPDLHLQPRRPGRHHGDDPRRSARASAASEAGRRSWRPASRRASPRSAKRVAGRRRPRTLLVFERESMALRGIYASGGIGFIHDMLEAAGGDERLRGREAPGGAGDDGADPVAAPGRDSRICAAEELAGDRGRETRGLAGAALGTRGPHRARLLHRRSSARSSPVRGSPRRSSSSRGRCTRRRSK